MLRYHNATEQRQHDQAGKRPLPNITEFINFFSKNDLINVNVKNIHRWRRMSRVRIRGAGGRRNVRLRHMQQRTVLFSDVP